MKFMIGFIIVMLMAIGYVEYHKAHATMSYRYGEVSGYPTCNESWCRTPVRWKPDGRESIVRFYPRDAPVPGEKVKQECYNYIDGDVSCDEYLLGL